MTKTTFKLFGYGSLNKSMIEALTGTKIAQPKPAFIKNHVRIFSGYSDYWGGAVASIHPFSGHRVYGSVVELTRSEIASLDEYEGIDPSNPSDGYYRRVKRAVFVREGDRLEKHMCFVYIKTALMYEAAPSTRYINSIKANLRTVGQEHKDPIDIFGVVMIQDKPVIMQVLRRPTPESSPVLTPSKRRNETVQHDGRRTRHNAHQRNHPQRDPQHPRKRRSPLQKHHGQVRPEH